MARSSQLESLEARVVLTASGVPGNDNPPDLNLSAISEQNIVVGQAYTIDLFANGATVVDLDANDNPTGDAIRLLLDPDIGTDTPVGAKITTDGVFTWTPTADQVGTYRIIVIAVDRGTTPLADSEVFTIVVSATGNQSPSVDLNGPDAGTGYNGTFTEDGGAVPAVGSNLTVTDGDSANLESAKVVLTNHPDGTAESLAVDVTGTNITASYDSATGELTLTGTDSLANYQAVLRTLTYNNTSDTPDETVRTIEVTVNDGNSDSVKAVSKISVVAVNDAPTVDLNGEDVGTGFESTFTEDGGPVAIVDTDAIVDDVDSTTLTSATVTITNLFDGDAEVLAVDTTGTSLVASYVGGVLTITGNGTLAEYQQVLRTLTYDNTSQNPNETQREISVVVNDGEDDSIAAIALVNVVGENDSPDLEPISDQVATVGELFEITVTATDPDGDVLTFQLDRDDPSGNIPASATITKTSDTTAVISWTPSESDGPGPFVFVVLVTDDDATLPLSDQESFTVTLEANESPVVDLNGEDEGVDFESTFTEDGGPVAIVDTDAVVTDTDSTELTSATVTITNLLDGDSEVLAVDTTGTSITASYDTATGVLTLSGTASLADYQQVLRTLTYDNSSQNPDETQREVTVVVNDGNSDSVAATAFVNVVGQNDPPNLEPIADQQVVVGELFEITVTATDPDGDVLTFQLDRDGVGSNIPASATITKTSDTTAVISWTPAESDGAGPFVFVVLVTDDDATLPLSDQETFTVTLAANEAPTVDLNGEGTGVDFESTFTEDGGPVSIVGTDLTVDDTDGTELTSATVTITNLLDGDAEALAVDTTGTSITASYDTATGVLTLSGTASLADYQQVLRTLTYDNSSQNPDETQREISVVVNDGEDDSVAATALVNVVGTNDSPDLEPIDDQSAQVGQLFEITITATDPDGDSLTFQLDRDDPNSTIPASATITKTSDTTAVISWTPAESDGAGPFVFVVLVTDDDGDLPLSDQESFTVTLAGAPPAVDLNGDETGIDFEATFTEEGGAVAVVDSEMTVTDSDSTNLESATVQLVNFPNGTGEVLAVDVTGTSITASYDSATGILSLTGTDTVANYQLVLRTLTYNNTATEIDATLRTIEITVNDGDSDSAVATTSLTIELLVTEAPVVDLNGGDSGTGFTASYTEESTPVAIVDTDLSITDADSTELESATVTITNLLDGDAETLAVDTTGTSITTSYDSATGILTLTGTGTLADYEAVLRTLTYFNGSENPTETDRSIEIVVSDGTNDSLSATTVVSVIGVNDPPVFDAIADQTANLGQEMVVNITATDPDTASLTFSFDRTDPSGNIPASATITKTSDKGAQITWTPSESDGAGPFVFVVVVGDDDATTPLTAQTTFTVTLGGEAPVLDLNGDDAGTGFSNTFIEGTGAVDVVDTDLSITDSDSTNLESATIVLSDHQIDGTELLAVVTDGTNITASSYDDATGTLTLTGTDTLANYELVLRTLTYDNASEDPDTTDRTITIIVSDGTNDSVAAVSTIIVVPDNDSPDMVLPSPYDTGTAVEVNLNEEFSFTVSVTDPDNTFDEFTFLIDAEASNIPAQIAQPTISNPSGGTPGGTFTWTPTQAGTYTITLLVADGGGLADSETFIVTVVDNSAASLEGEAVDQALNDVLDESFM
ncbi:beta strand repeat-containing protein [Bremerella cremea]|uniref:beta strand repeat-containing protein n=1 Tax=Bremerella cremea TaxID=1031537 RepID=UPI0031E57CB3